MSCVHLSFSQYVSLRRGELVDADKARDDSPKARSSRLIVQWVRWGHRWVLGGWPRTRMGLARRDGGGPPPHKG